MGGNSSKMAEEIAQLRNDIKPLVDLQTSHVRMAFTETLRHKERMAEIEAQRDKEMMSEETARLHMEMMAKIIAQLHMERGIMTLIITLVAGLLILTQCVNWIKSSDNQMAFTETLRHKERMAEIEAQREKERMAEETARLHMKMMAFTETLRHKERMAEIEAQREKERRAEEMARLHMKMMAFTETLRHKERMSMRSLESSDSDVSLKSDWSKDEPIDFKDRVCPRLADFSSSKEEHVVADDEDLVESPDSQRATGSTEFIDSGVSVKSIFKDRVSVISIITLIITLVVVRVFILVRCVR